MSREMRHRSQQSEESTAETVVEASVKQIAEEQPASQASNQWQSYTAAAQASSQASAAAVDSLSAITSIAPTERIASGGSIYWSTIPILRLGLTVVTRRPLPLLLHSGFLLAAHLLEIPTSLLSALLHQLDIGQLHRRKHDTGETYQGFLTLRLLPLLFRPNSFVFQLAEESSVLLGILRRSGSRSTRLRGRDASSSTNPR